MLPTDNYFTLTQELTSCPTIVSNGEYMKLTTRASIKLCKVYASPDLNVTMKIMFGHCFKYCSHHTMIITKANNDQCTLLPHAADLRVWSKYITRDDNCYKD